MYKHWLEFTCKSSFVFVQAGSEFSAMFMWGRGREGQLGVGSMQDNSIPKIVEELKGRKILKVRLS